jgi:hypothetical protein
MQHIKLPKRRARIEESLVWRVKDGRDIGSSFTEGRWNMHKNATAKIIVVNSCVEVRTSSHKAWENPSCLIKP